MKNKTSKNHETPPLQQGAVMGSADVMTFGKHKGKTIEAIMEEDCSYLEWAIKKVEHFKVENELKEKILDKAWHDRYAEYDAGMHF